MKKNFLFSLLIVAATLSTHLHAQPTAPQTGYDHYSSYGQEWNPTYFASASLIHLDVCQTGLDYALAGDGAGPAARYEYDSDTGFRLTLGATLCDMWGAAIEYTDFSTSANHAASGTFALTDNSVSGLTNVSANANFDYRILDLNAGYSHCLSSAFDLTTFGGLRILYLDQDLTIKDGSGIVHESFSSELKAAGINLGVHGHWNLCSPWAAYASLNGSLVCGDDDSTMSNTSTGGPYKESICRGITGVGAALGLNYSACLCGFIFDLSLGYEANYWENIPSRYRISDSIATPDTGSYLLLHGWEVRVDACF